MVLESLIGEKNIRKNPFFIFIITVIVTLGSIFFAHQLFPKESSVLSVAFVTIALVPIIHNILAKEEYEEVLARKSSTSFLSRHYKVILLYVWIFIGVIFAFSLAYVVTPQEMKADVFNQQINAYCAITGSCDPLPASITGQFSGAFNACQNPNTRNVFSCSVYIFENNFSVLIFIILLSVLYGAGAIFIIVWNASILGLFFGEMILTGGVMKGLSLAQGMIIGHGPPELLSYVFGALAGAILSSMISKGQLLKHEFSIISKDLIFLLVLAFISVFFGAFVEAVGILGFVNLYFILGFIYVLIIIFLFFFFGKNDRSFPN
jgi:hypothetical protein